MKPHDEWNSADAALAEMGGVQVVPLEWDDYPYAGWKRGRVVGLSPRGKTEATIFRVAGGWQYMGDVYLAAHDSLDAALGRAKAAAQADYEARILAAIEPAPSVREEALEKIEASLRHIESCLTFPVSTEINKRGYDTRSPTPETVEYMVDEVRTAKAALRTLTEGKE